MKYFYLLVFILFFSACSNKQDIAIKTNGVAVQKQESVEDLTLIPQEPNYFAVDLKSSYIGNIE
ncbi:MAG: hypothetical protein P8Y22_00410, partial [Sulfurimonas sp.]